ncbi:MAG: 2-oxoacid:acceptor oxidoreductase family protein [Rikenellaceae bacterium]|nr:2-oxoacid:acceptor oxidoreductase family protein [Rikenellaceae bacterium]MDE7356153.1 2-oxoacid:acceptor oxidoreductase family protein [Rikenellaceae bacterium]
MTHELIIAGFGGQGVLSMGKILAYSAVMQGKQVTWMPSYGPEMRGGTANVTVIISDEDISSPISQSYDTVIVLNQQSLDKFEKSVRPGGSLIYDPNGISTPPSRKDIKIYTVDAAAAAARSGNSKVFNMIVLGAFLKVNPIVELGYVSQGLKKSLPERVHHTLPQNEEAIRQGMDIVTES